MLKKDVFSIIIYYILIPFLIIYTLIFFSVCNTPDEFMNIDFFFLLNSISYLYFHQEIKSKILNTFGNPCIVFSVQECKN